MTKVIGLDTSSTCTGYSIFIDGKYNESGCFNHKKNKDTYSRQECMCKDIISFLDEQNPDIVYWEIPFLGRNPETQKILGMITGVVYGWCLSHNKIYDSFKPSEWRKLVKEKDEKLPKKRNELKQWSVSKVGKIFGKNVEDDEADSVLISLAGINKYKD